MSIPLRKFKAHRLEEVTAYRCPGCGDLHEDEDDAIDCCNFGDDESLDADVESGLSEECPACRRVHSIHTVDAIAIGIAGHCTECNPLFTYQQKRDIEDAVEAADALLSEVEP